MKTHILELGNNDRDILAVMSWVRIPYKPEFFQAFIFALRESQFKQLRSSHCNCEVARKFRFTCDGHIFISFEVSAVHIIKIKILCFIPLSG